jgi:hypothetical protein
MASIVAFIELRGGLVTRPSRHLLGESRRVADRVGATVYALFTVGEIGQTRIDQIATELSAAGADRILCSSAAQLGGPALDATHGGLLAQVAEHLRPLLFLFPAGGVVSQLGPLLAVRIGAAYLPNASLEVSADQATPICDRVVLSRWRAAHDGQRRVDIKELERPVVASLGCGVLPPALGEPYAEVEMLPYPESGHHGCSLREATDDPTAASEVCSAMVWTAAPEHVAAAFPQGAPAGVALVAAGAADALVIGAASPSEVYWFCPASPPARPLALLAPGATVTMVVGSETTP